MGIRLVPAGLRFTPPRSLAARGEHLSTRGQGWDRGSGNVHVSHILCGFAKRPVSRSLFVWQTVRHHASRFALLTCAHPWAHSLPAFLTIPPFPTLLPVSFCCPSRTAHCLLLTQVLTQSRLTCPEANTRIRSDTSGLRSDRSKLDTGLRPA
jgi:hypothetical protein